MSYDHCYPEEVKTAAITRRVKRFVYEREAKQKIERMVPVAFGENTERSLCRDGIAASDIERLDIDVYLPTGKVERGFNEYRYNHTVFGKAKV